MDVLEYVHGLRLRRVLRKIEHALRPGGLLMVNECKADGLVERSWFWKYLGEGADNLIYFLVKTPGLQLLHLENYPEDDCSVPGYPNHVIALFRKSTSTSGGRNRWSLKPFPKS